MTINPFFCMSVSQNRVAHCPKCHKPLLNSGQFYGFAQFSMRCSWCQTIVSITIEPQIVATVKMSAPAEESKDHSIKRERQASILENQTTETEVGIEVFEISSE